MADLKAPAPATSDAELLKALDRFGPSTGKTITLYHVDETGRTLAAADRNHSVGLRAGEFWLTTNVEARSGFKSGAGLDKILAFRLDDRFVKLLIDVAQKPSDAAAVEKVIELVGQKTKVQVGTHPQKGPVKLDGRFNTPLAIPRVTFEGGGRGAAHLSGKDFNIGIFVTEDVRQWARLFQLSIRQIDHLRLDESRPAGSRLVAVKQLFPPLPPSSGGGPSGGGPPSGGPSSPKASSAGSALQRTFSNLSIREMMKSQVAPRARLLARNGNIAGAKARALADLGQSLNRSRVETLIDATIAKNEATIAGILETGHGVLLIIRIEEGPRNDTGHKMASPSSISFARGSSEEAAKAAWLGVSRMFAAPPKGGRIIESYMWIPAGN